VHANLQDRYNNDAVVKPGVEIKLAQIQARFDVPSLNI
jgi:hypothetical protein